MKEKILAKYKLNTLGFSKDTAPMVGVGPRVRNRRKQLWILGRLRSCGGQVRD